MCRVCTLCALLFTLPAVLGANQPTCAGALEAIESILPEDDARYTAVQAAPKNAAAHVALASAVLIQTQLEPAAGNQELGTGSLSNTDAAVEVLWYALEVLNGGIATPTNETLHAEAMNLLLDAAESWSTPEGHAATEDRASEKATALYERLFAATPDDPTPLFGLAAQQQRAGKHAAVVTTLSKALALAPSDGAAQLSLALSHVALGQWDQGVEAAKACKALHEAKLAAVEKLHSEGKLEEQFPGVDLRTERETAQRGVSQAMTMLGVIILQRTDDLTESDVQAALSHLRAAVAADAGNEDAASKLAKLEAAVEEHERATKTREAKVDAADAAEAAAVEADDGDASAYDLDAEDEGVAM